MSACFYDNGGVMAGVDSHTYITIGPAEVPIPVLMTPHVVGTAFWAPGDAAKRTPTVTAVGNKMIKVGFKNYVVPHLPLTSLPPHPAQAGNLGVIILLSSSKAYLGVAAVTGEGGELATCVMGPVGANVNCGPGVGVVFNPSSVVTSPTAGDFASAVVNIAIDQALGVVAGKLIPKSVKDQLAKGILKKIIKKVLKTVLGAAAAAATGGA